MNAETKIKAGGVHRKLSTARQKFHALKLTKTGKNTFAGYQYFELGDFLVPALKVFDEVGLGAMISFTADTATMTIVDLDNTEDRIVITSPMGSAALKGCHEVQNIGAVETYQRRYLWVAALEIVEHDALDATTGSSANFQTGEEPAKPREKLEGPYPSPTALKGAVKAFATTLAQQDDLGGLSAWLETPEVVELEKQAMRYLPDWWDEGIPDKPEFEPITSRIERKRKELTEIDELRNVRTPIDAG